MLLLLVEDDVDTADYVTNGLNERGHVVDRAGDGHGGLMMATGSKYDAMIIDRMIPGVDGFRLLSMLRAGGNTTPAIFLTAIASIEDRVEGLEIADDYLVKPFAFSELYARIGVIVRRPISEPAQSTFRAGDLTVDLIRRTVHRDGRELQVQPTEFRLLEYLLRHKGRVVTRTMLLENVWDFHFDPKTNIVETHISRLRSKIDRDFDHALIHTVRGAGYMINDES